MIMVFIPRVHDLMIDDRSQTEKPDQALVISDFDCPLDQVSQFDSA